MNVGKSSFEYLFLGVELSGEVNSLIPGKCLQAADLKIAIKGSAAVRHEVKERQDGALEISYAAPMSGEYRITMALGSFSVPGSPFKVPCQQPRPCEVLSRVYYGSGQAFAGERYSTRVTVLDQFGQRVAGDPRCKIPRILTM